MRLVTFDKSGGDKSGGDKSGRATAGVRRDGAIVDLSVAAPELPGDWPAIFASDSMDRVAEAARSAGEDAVAAKLPVASLQTSPPETRIQGPVPDAGILFGACNRDDD